ncbi:NADH-quinone oxidoreductase subunit NuoG [Thiotrichales bacterium 19S11-10]|nr:NADH-quinone oxidoreductase subunit NuoG [Thiotrichales bacterium 19S11-10]
MAEKEAPKEITLEINGKPLKAKQGQMVIEVADENNIYIPRFCYHKKLSVAANCRMCLVDMENARKPSPACATPAMDGMKVYTKNKKTLEYQKTIMEFLLINHPLDCPICDQGGECELQDVALGYGKDASRFSEGKRVVSDPDLGSLIATDMTRCIQCTRCVRFGKEIAGVAELGATGRGEHMKIGTYVQKTVNSELSGNMIDVCPVGALTSKPFQYKARAWELVQKPSIAPFDSLGSHQYLHLRRGELLRTVPKECESINETWLSDRDRFGYEGVNHSDRIKEPMIKKRGEWEVVSWEEALDFTKTALQFVKDNHSAEQIGAIAHPSSTLESLYLLQKLVRALGSNSIDTRIFQSDVKSPISYGQGLDLSLEAIEESEHILLIGSNLRKEIPLLNHRVRKAALKGAKVSAICSKANQYNFDLNEVVVDVDQLCYMLAAVVKSSLKLSKQTVSIDSNLGEFLADIKVNAESDRIARSLIQSENIVILLGQSAVMHPQYAMLLLLAETLKQITNASFGVVGFGANAVGADYVCALPYVNEKGDYLENTGFNIEEILSGKSSLSACILLNIEPEVDTLAGAMAIKNLKQMDYVINLSSYQSESMLAYSDVILPISSYCESDGSYMNIERHLQSFEAVKSPLALSKPAWKVLRVLANFLDITGFEYQSANEIQNEIQARNQNIAEIDQSVHLAKAIDFKLPPFNDAFSRLLSVSLYHVDGTLRRAGALQQTEEAQAASYVKVSGHVAYEYGFNPGQKIRVVQGQSEAILPVLIDPNLANNSIEVQAGIEKSLSLWDHTAAITLEKIEVEEKVG